MPKCATGLAGADVYRGTLGVRGAPDPIPVADNQRREDQKDSAADQRSNGDRSGPQWLR